MANNNNHNININANISGLADGVNGAERLLDSLANQATDLNGVLGSLGRGISSAGGLSPAFRLLGGSLGVAAAGITALMASAQKASEIDQLAQTARMTSDTLQQLKAEFAATGMEMSNFADMNKDALKNFGAAVRAGGGIADELKKYGLKLEDFTAHIAGANGGINATISLFYKMREAGASISEISASMEALAGGSSEMISHLQNYQTDQEAMNAVGKQSVSVTEDSIKAFRELGTRLSEFQDASSSALANGLAPFAQKMSDLYDWCKKVKGELAEVSKKMGGPVLGASGMSRGQQQQGFGHISKEQLAEQKYQKDVAAAREKAEKNFQQNQKDIAARKEAEAEAKRINDEIARVNAEKAAAEKEKADKAAKAAADKAAREAKAAADKAQREEEQRQKEYEQWKKSSFDALNKLTIDSYSSQAATISSAQSKLQESFKSLDDLYEQNLISEDAYHQRKATLQDAYAENFGSFVLGMNLEDIEKVQEASEQAYTRDLENLQNSYEQKLIAVEEFESRKQAIISAHAEREREIDKATNAAKVQQYSDYMMAAGGMLDAFGGQSKKAALASFALQKGAAIAEATMAAYTAYADGVSKGGWAGFLLAGSKMAAALQQVASIKSTKLAGMAHDGIDNVPREGTWLLDRGERVVDKRTNADLKTFLNDSEGSGQPITINAPLNISGNVNSSDRMVMEALKKHPQEIRRLVDEATRRSM
ncbi:hypothetical protein [Atlantibacter subterraneus]|uniref:hypothetical protein n=1 Tax=Atlantibacter subterraneus TaxID=255519 RepID=UPI0022EA79F7|nr:hypothetical protein [Atlantibacter subterranea]MDA3133460.1 hypothetical protein [Atlantibacter subterranea]